MAARRRESKHRGWPTNLYENADGYLYFRHPVTKKTFGLGRNLREAIAEVKVVNAQIALEGEKRSLLDRVNAGGHTVSKWADEYMTPIRERLEGKASLGHAELEIRKIVAEIGTLLVAEVTPRHIVEMLKACDQYGSSIGKKVRTRASNLFRDAINHGLIPPGQNPVESTFTPKSTVKRSRLTLETFTTIREAAGSIERMRWFVNAIDLAAITGQRLGDIRAMTRQSVRDGFVWVEQEKTSVRLKIPLDVYSPIVKMTLAEAVDACKSKIVGAPLIHLRETDRGAVAGVCPDNATFSSNFKAMLRKIGYQPEVGRTDPTFHEIRSLAARIYTEAYGRDFAQAILGHKTASMTDIYRDTRGNDWQSIKISA